MKFLLIALVGLLNQHVLNADSSSMDLKERAKEAHNYCLKNNYNTEVCIIIDMKIHSGKNRMFIWNMKNGCLIDQGLCTHGTCDALPGGCYSVDWTCFSNTPNSHCSSLGKYRIGKRGYSNWGIHVNYKLHGLENTNNNALKRVIVLHSWSSVKDYETYPLAAPESWGCPAVSDEFMKRIDELLQRQEKPILLWIYN